MLDYSSSTVGGGEEIGQEMRDRYVRSKSRCSGSFGVISLLLPFWQKEKARLLGSGVLPGLVDTGDAATAEPAKSGLFSFFSRCVDGGEAVTIPVYFFCASYITPACSRCSLTGSSVVTKENLQPVLDKMREHLIGKNVAADIAQRLCQSVGERLEGTTKSSFQALSTLVRDSLQQSLTQILSPKRHIDVLRDIQSAKRQGRPFTIVFCGVNGKGWTRELRGLKSVRFANAEFYVNRRGKIHEPGQNCLLAAEQQAARADCGLRHLPCWRCGAGEG